ncbi:unnamed protein product [Caenorhabditis auriculariae]|uniref:Uncharacterized protein n=1 Tax=Caenorhabditis auriculariae TaxID=2777116 RepID=A0A8S1HFN4_9PELO|nr:unnamed protein product [Caenorhabditis auriculariae]
MRYLAVFVIFFGFCLFSTDGRRRRSQRAKEPVPFPFGIETRRDPFAPGAGIGETLQKSRSVHPLSTHIYTEGNDWGWIEEKEVKVKEDVKRKTDEEEKTDDEKAAADLTEAIRNAQYGITTTVLPPDPRHNGLLKDVGSVGVGFGVGVGVPGNDPVAVSARVAVGLDGSGPAAGLPAVYEYIYPRPGEHQSLNDYDGNKDLIQSGKAKKYFDAVRLGWIKVPQYQAPKSTAEVSGGIGIGTNTPTGGK